jgi:radical SAM superfamily enzyme YgiQ (UPF0313 family)
MRVLLLTPPYVPNFMRNARWDVIGISGSQWYPIWLAYCAGLLEKHGHTVKLVDAQVDNLTRQQVYDIALTFKPDLTVVYFSNKALINDIEVSESLHNLTGSQIVLVGSSASIDSDKALLMSQEVNILAQGEFDYTILELANGKPIHEIDGLRYKQGLQLPHQTVIHTNDSRQPVTADQLADFPFVTRTYHKHLNTRNYHHSAHKYPFVDLFTGRGCEWGHCTFCLWPHTINKGAGYRTRPIADVVNELWCIKVEMPEVKEVFIQDDTLPEWRCRELSEAIISNHLAMCWSCYARANMSYKTMALMKRAGCRAMHVGYESANPQILHNIKKGITKERMEKFTRDAHEAGLYIVADFVTGLPGETVDTIKETVAWAKNLKADRYTITLPKPYPCTPFYEQLNKNGWLDSNGRPSYPGLSAEEIYRWNKWSVRQVYLNGGYLARMLRQPSEWDRLVRSAKYVAPFLRQKADACSEDSLEW